VTAGEIRATTKEDIMQIQREFAAAAALELFALEREGGWQCNSGDGDQGSSTGEAPGGLVREAAGDDTVTAGSDGAGDRPCSSGDQRVFTGSFLYYGSPDLPEDVTPGTVQARIYNLVG
jgi:hypothetical protein